MKSFILFLVLAVAGTISVQVFAWTPAPVAEDPLVRMPGTQPPPENNVDIESPTRCLNCHGGFDSAIEPAFNWQGSMMAQAARDPIFWACLTVAAQDAIWAVGNPNATDICERCHFPKGWLEGRSDPTNASLFTGSDYDGVQCDVCHSMFDPFFETTHAGTREGSDWLGYWDETNASSTPSQPAADATYDEDLRLSASIKLFSGGSFYGADNNPLYATYIENSSGQMFMDDVKAKRASFADAQAKHATFYSRYHKSKYFCSTCHDVSNPILANLGLSGLVDQLGNDGKNHLITEQYNAGSYFHVERTFSEFMLSAYGQQGGAPTNQDFRDQGAPGIAVAAKCQDCHMRDVVGKAASQNSAVIRPTNSVEHPNSGQPLHDLTGGNAWIGYILASTDSSSTNYDSYNKNLLVNQPYGPLTLDINQGDGINPERLLAAVDRAKQQLHLAATIKGPGCDASSIQYSNGTLHFCIQNNTGHKLISGFPEGRRMFVNVKVYSGGNLIREVNPYDTAAGTLKGLDYPYIAGQGLPAPQLLTSTEVVDDSLVYEGKPSSENLTGEEHTFHFALATNRYKDNRIPPKGFNITKAAARLAQPRKNGVDASNLYTSAEYSGGYDDISLTIPSGADYIEVNLYYQTTSREYIEFLRDEINGTESGNLTLVGTGAGGDPAYIAQTDSFFDGLRGWGNTIWDLWVHNMNVPGAAPILMAQATVGTPPNGGSCNPPSSAPVISSASPSSNQVTLTWLAVTGGADGYKVYYDQTGKAQLVANVGNTTTYTDTGLTNGNEYCYKITAYNICDSQTLESAFSNIECATPQATGQNTLADVESVQTGYYVTTGKGPNKTTTFTLTNSFQAGDGVVIRAYVKDDSGQPVSNASVDIAITGKETVSLTAGPSDDAGLAEVTWSTSTPNRKGTGGTTPGTYNATATNVTGGGIIYSAELTPSDASVTFTIQ
jgi:hypothetical protein